MESIIRQRFQESIETKNNFLHDDVQVQAVLDAAEMIISSLKSNGKLLVCGNGGSAADAMHIAGEILGRFIMERPGYAAVALNADVATMTAIANDYGYEYVFSRQVEGLMDPGDVLLGISTSGNSANVINAFAKAREKGGKTILLAGKNGGKLKEMADVAIVVQEQVTARIQECHVCIYHILCELVEDALCNK